MDPWPVAYNRRLASSRGPSPDHLETCIVVKLIRRHNRLQFRRGVYDLALSLLATIATFAFFYLAFRFLINAYGTEALLPWLMPVVITVMVLNFATGWFAYGRGVGQSDYHETDLFVNLGYGMTGGGTVASIYAARATGPAYLVSQIALGAPLHLFKGLQELRFRVPESDAFEQRMNGLLDSIVSKKRWHSIAPYRELSSEFACLIRLDAVDFSPRKGSVKARSEFVAQVHH